MIHRIYFILLLLSLSFTAKAQLGKELILNGGFEEYAKVTPPPSGEDDEEDEVKNLPAILILIKNRFIGISTRRYSIREPRMRTAVYSP